MDWIYNLACWGLGLFFIFAGVLKLVSPLTFATLIEAYGILPELLVLPVAIALPVLEVAAGIGLILHIKGSLGAIAALLLLFVAILAYGIWMGLDVDCGCFGPQDPEAKSFHGLRSTLYRDLAIFAGVVLVYGWRRYRAIEPIQLTRFIKNRYTLWKGKGTHA